MWKKVIPMLLAGGLALVLPGPSACAGGAAPPELADVAVSYANALASGEPAKAWDLLSSESRSKLTPAEWDGAFAKRPPARKPPATALLRPLATGDQPVPLGDVLIRPQEALIEVRGTVDVTHILVLVRESVGWRVDLEASDQLNSRHAAQIFLDALREEAGMASRRPTRRPLPASQLALLRALLMPEAKDYRVLDAKVEEDRAEVTVAAAVPVNLVLRAGRSGPGWMVDLARPLLPIDSATDHPLQEAAAAADQTTCEEQLRQLARAIQMYAAASDDLLPDPDRWLDQIRPYIPRGTQLHCPSDPQPGTSYAFNRNLAGKRRREVANPALVPMLFESTLHTANPADTGESWPTTSRHPAGSLVAFLDGSVRPMAGKPGFEVRPGRPGAVRVTPGPPGRLGPRAR